MQRLKKWQGAWNFYVLKRSMCQQKTKVYIELEEIWKHLMKAPEWKYKGMQKNISNKAQCAKHICEGEEIKQQERKVWNQGDEKGSNMTAVARLMDRNP